VLQILPNDHLKALGVVRLEGPRGVLFLMSEVPLNKFDETGTAGTSLIRNRHPPWDHLKPTVGC
jgi:hypothetical protein